MGEASRQEIIHQLSSISKVEALENAGGNLLLLVSGIHAGFFGYGYPLIKASLPLENITLAAIEDIGLMKCDALISRGGRKDFYDLFYISRFIELEALISLSEKKYALFRDFPLMVLESMTLFDNADRDRQSELFDNVSWDEVKQFFIAQAKVLSKRWFE